MAYFTSLKRCFIRALSVFSFAPTILSCYWISFTLADSHYPIDVASSKPSMMSIQFLSMLSE
jgi:hypothetical protein